MYQGGGPPPYGPGGPAGAPGYPQRSSKSSAGTWIVIGGGAVIVILVIAVVVVVLQQNSGDDGGAQAGGNGQEEQSGGSGESQSGGSEESGDSEGSGDSQAQGEPPYELPEEACEVIPESTAEGYNMDDGSKNLSENSSTCNWSVDGEGDAYGSVGLSYDVPYSGSDSVEGAEEDFETNVDYATDESGDVVERTVDQEEEIDLGDEATLVFGTEKTLDTNDSVATMLIRSENMNIEVRYMMSPGLDAGEDDPPPLEYSDVEDMMYDLGEQAVSEVGG